jgi:hypothetical protein
VELVSKLASAIATAEGWWAAGKDPPRNRRNHNPGNLTASPLNRRKDGPFVRFESDAEGTAALCQQILRHVLRGYTLRQLITAWAPPSENDTENYIRETVRRTGLDPEKKLWDYLELERIV